jgi:hypothetical protein
VDPFVRRADRPDFIRMLAIAVQIRPAILGSLLLLVPAFGAPGRRAVLLPLAWGACAAVALPRSANGSPFALCRFIDPSRRRQWR